MMTFFKHKEILYWKLHLVKFKHIIGKSEIKISFWSKQTPLYLIQNGYKIISIESINSFFILNMHFIEI